MRSFAICVLIGLGAALASTSCSSSDGGSGKSDNAAAISSLAGASQDVIVKACESLVGTGSKVSKDLDHKVLVTGGGMGLDIDSRPALSCDYEDGDGEVAVTVWLTVYPSEKAAADAISIDGDSMDHSGSVAVYVEDNEQTLTSTEREAAQRAIAKRL